VVVEERPVSVRLRFLEEGTGRPVAGAGVALWSSAAAGQFLSSAPAPFDAGRTDAEGLFSPEWPARVPTALIRLADGAGRQLWTVLRGIDAEAMVPREIVVREEPVSIAVSCVREGTGRPVPGAFVCLGTNGGIFWGVSDAGGGILLRFLESDSLDPGALEVQSWTACWRDGEGPVRWDHGGIWDGRTPPHPAGSPAPMVLRLGAHGAPGVWVEVRRKAGTGSFRPATLAVSKEGDDPLRAGWLSMVGPFQPAGIEGRALWWSLHDPRQEAGADLPAEARLAFDLTGAEGEVLRAAGTRGDLLAASDPARALLFEVTPRGTMARKVRVLSPAGRPAAGALVAVLEERGGVLYLGDRQRERASAGPDGVASLAALDPAGGDRVLAWDPASGACGLLPSPGEGAPPGAWTLRLEEPAPFRVRPLLPDGSPAAAGTAMLFPMSPDLPTVGAAWKDGEVTAPPLGLAGYRAYLAVYADRRSCTKVAPASGINGTSVTLEAR
jgi:hypothetical protein